MPLLPPPANQGDTALQLLREFLGDSAAQFRSPQQRAALLHLLLNSYPSMFLILPTGGGKSTFFLLCASIALPRVTIIIVPLLALKHNLAQKATQLGLDFRIWEQTDERAITQGSFDLILVSMETAANFTFARVVRGLIEQQKISRIIFDEAHLIDTHKRFRSDFHMLGFLGSLQVPLFLASATLTSASVNSIRSMLHLGNSMVIRGDISNPNITYIVEDYPSEPKAQREKVYHYLIANLGPHGKAIIFFMSIPEIDNFYDSWNRAENASIYRYHSKLTDAEKEHEIDSFEISPKAVLVGTTGIGAGFDFQDISLVIFAGGAYDFYDFVQGSGRVARSPSSKGKAILLWKRGKSTKDDNLSAFVSETVCRRRVIKKVFNNSASEGCSASEDKCDLCMARTELFTRHTKESRTQARARTHALEFLIDRVNFWVSGPCLICFLQEIGKCRAPISIFYTIY